MLLNQKFKKIIPYRSIIKVYLLIIFSIFISLLDLLSLGSIPILVGSLFDHNFLLNIKLNYLQANIEYIQKENFIPIFVILLFISKGFLSLFFLIYQNYIYRDLTILVSNKLFKNYIFQDYLKINNYTTSVLIRNLINEVNLTIDYLKTLVNFLKEISLFIFIFIGCLFLSAKFTILISLFFFLFVSIFFFSVRLLLKKSSLDLQIFREKQLENINQTFRAIHDIKVSLLEKFAIDEYSNNVSKRYKLEYLSQIITGIPKVILEVVVIIFLLSFIYFFLIGNYQLDQVFGILSLLTIILVRFVPTFNIISSSLAKFKSIGSSLNLVSNEIIKKNLFIKENHNYKLSFEKKVVFKKLNFQYERKSLQIFKNLNLVIKKGDFIGIFGESGSGKSTFLNIFSGLITSKKGYFWADGKKVDQNNIISWYNSISYVPQNNYIFDDTIKNNICLGLKESEIDTENFKKSIICSTLDSVNLDLKNFKCGEGGKFLSFGQKQRLAIARGIYKNKKILILDECTSNLDSVTERKLLERINHLKDDATIVIVSHKLSSLKFCNKIFKMENGKLERKE